MTGNGMDDGSQFRKAVVNLTDIVGQAIKSLVQEKSVYYAEVPLGNPP